MPYAPTLNNHYVLRWGRRRRPFNMGRKTDPGKNSYPFQEGRMPYAPTLDNHDIHRWGLRRRPFNMGRNQILGKIYIRFKKGVCHTPLR